MLLVRDQVPNGSLPAVVVDGRVATDSLDAMFLLERLFPNPQRPMRLGGSKHQHLTWGFSSLNKLRFPVFSRLRNSALQLLELHRAVVGAWSFWVQFLGHRIWRPSLAINLGV